MSWIIFPAVIKTLRVTIVKSTHFLLEWSFFQYITPFRSWNMLCPGVLLPSPSHVLSLIAGCASLWTLRFLAPNTRGTMGRICGRRLCNIDVYHVYNYCPNDSFMSDLQLCNKGTEASGCLAATATVQRWEENDVANDPLIWTAICYKKAKWIGKIKFKLS